MAVIVGLRVTVDVAVAPGVAVAVLIGAAVALAAAVTVGTEAGALAVTCSTATTASPAGGCTAMFGGLCEHAATNPFMANVARKNRVTALNTICPIFIPDSVAVHREGHDLLRNKRR